MRTPAHTDKCCKHTLDGAKTVQMSVHSSIAMTELLTKKLKEKKQKKKKPATTLQLDHPNFAHLWIHLSCGVKLTAKNPNYTSLNSTN